MNWQPVMILITPLRADSLRLLQSACLQIERCHLAPTPDGILIASWDMPLAERVYPRAQLTGWKPTRDVPFRLPIRFEHRNHPAIVTLIPRGAWVLPYDDLLFHQYQHLAEQLTVLYQSIDQDPLRFPTYPFHLEGDN